MADHDDDWYKPHRGGCVELRQSKPGELLFEFVRASNQAPGAALNRHLEVRALDDQSLPSGRLRA